MNLALELPRDCSNLIDRHTHSLRLLALPKLFHTFILRGFIAHCALLSATCICQHMLDAVNFRCDVPSRKTCDFRSRCCVHAFEISQHHLPVERLELVDQHVKPRDGVTLPGGILSLCRIGKIGQLLKVDKLALSIRIWRATCDAAVLCATR